MTPATKNQNPEQIARDQIDAKLAEAGWRVQDKSKIDFNAGQGIAVREYPTDIGPADYVLFVDRRAVGVIEAKPEDWGHRITVVEEQAEGYAAANLKWVKNQEPLPFVYQTTGVITRFTDGRDPYPRSREVFTFPRPETLAEWLSKPQSLRARLQNIPPLDPSGFRACQITAIKNLENSFKADRPRALMQMATGSGKTFTAISSVYRLLKHADAKRILFLVDTRNLGQQAEQEFMSYLPNDENRKFTELYNVQLLKNSYVAGSSQVCISTIQRMYSILKDESLDESAEDENPAERLVRPKQPLPVIYNPKYPPEYFDFIIIDECHRSIYNVWRQVIEYFDAFLIGLTATPDARTYGFFKKNIVSEYSHERAVADGVNVGNEIFVIDTEVTKQGTTVRAEQQIEKRERLTRKKRWERQDNDELFGATQLDRAVVIPDQIRTIVRTFRDKLPEIFPGRDEVPKTLIFAKTDSHADDIIQIVREEFDQGNDFCKKITYQSTEDPKSVLAQFRNNYNPRIAVTVDMIATGTDVRPLECLLFMRDVRSRNYFEQMKGRGTRVIEADDLKKVTPSAKAKTHYVIVDAVGVTRSVKTASQPLITKPNVSLKDLATGVMMGVRDEDTVSSLAGRLARLDRQLEDEDRQRIAELAGGTRLTEIVSGLLNAIDADRVEEASKLEFKCEEPTDTGVATGRVWSESREKEELAITVVGRTLSIFQQSNLPAKDSAWFDRQRLALGDAGQESLRNLHVGIVGMGGTGSVAFLQLVHLGIRRITVIDGDHVAASNVSRILGATADDAGRTWKVDVAARYARQLGFGADIHCLKGHFGKDVPPAEIEGCDLVLSCVDRHLPRALLNRLSYEKAVPVIDMGSAFRVDARGKITAGAGRVVVVGPGRPCLACWGHIDPNRIRIESLSETDRTRDVADGYIDGAEVQQPSVIAFNTAVAGAAVIELMRLVTEFAGADDPPLRLSFDFESGTVRRNRLSEGSGCRSACLNRRRRTH